MDPFHPFFDQFNSLDSFSSDNDSNIPYTPFSVEEESNAAQFFSFIPQTPLSSSTHHRQLNCSRPASFQGNLSNLSSKTSSAYASQIHTWNVPEDISIIHPQPQPYQLPTTQHPPSYYGNLQNNNHPPQFYLRPYLSALEETTIPTLNTTENVSAIPQQPQTPQLPSMHDITPQPLLSSPYSANPSSNQKKRQRQSSSMDSTQDSLFDHFKYIPKHSSRKKQKCVQENHESYGQENHELTDLIQSNYLINTIMKKTKEIKPINIEAKNLEIDSDYLKNLSVEELRTKKNQLRYLKGRPRTQMNFQTQAQTGVEKPQATSMHVPPMIAEIKDLINKRRHEIRMLEFKIMKLIGVCEILNKNKDSQTKLDIIQQIEIFNEKIISNNLIYTEIEAENNEAIQNYANQLRLRILELENIHQGLREIFKNLNFHI